MFLFNFTGINENFLKSWIFENPKFTFDINRRNYLKREFFNDTEIQNFGLSIIKLTPADFLDNNRDVVSLAEFIRRTHITISDLKYNKLRSIILTAKLTFQKTNKIEQKTDMVQNFCMRIKKGSKKFRKIIDIQNPLIVSPNMFTYSECTETIINSQNSGLLNELWCKNYFGNSMKTFLFKLHNNILGINSRVAHFVRGHPNTCTFCDLQKVSLENPESITHLFFDCEIVETLLSQFYTWIFNHQRHINRSEYFIGFEMEDNNKKEILNIVNCIAKRYIWECKLRFTLPCINGLKIFFVGEYNAVMIYGRSIREKHISANLLSHIREIHF